MELSAINLTQILTTLITTIGAIVCAALGRKEDQKKILDSETRRDGDKKTISIWAWGMWTCIAIALINTGILGFRLFRPPAPTEVVINYPINLAQANQTEVVRGTFEGLPEGKVIWVVLFIPDVGRYYPQNRPADLEAGNKWSSLAYLGIPSDTGKRFDILAVVADSEAQNAFNAYLAEARDRNNWAGLETLPPGAVIHARITVTRK